MLRRAALLMLCLWNALAFAEEPAAGKAKAAEKPFVVRLQEDLPEAFLERLRVPVNAEIRHPLEMTFQELFRAINVNCVMDGNALKFSGITKNEIQQLSRQNQPLYEVIVSILERKDRTQTYPDIALLWDEGTKTVTVTTNREAERLGRKPIDLRALRPAE